MAEGFNYSGRVTCDGVIIPKDGQYIAVDNYLSLEFNVKTSEPLLIITLWSPDGITNSIELSHTVRSKESFKTGTLLPYLKIRIMPRGVKSSSVDLYCVGCPSKKRVSLPGILKSRSNPTSVNLPTVSEISLFPDGEDVVQEKRSKSPFRKWKMKSTPIKAPVFDDRIPNLLLKGSILFCAGPNYFTLLPPGNAGDCLTMGSDGLPMWQDFDYTQITVRD